MVEGAFGQLKRLKGLRKLRRLRKFSCLGVHEKVLANLFLETTPAIQISPLSMSCEGLNQGRWLADSVGHRSS